MQNNNISSLKGSIRKCTFLQKINLENNNLSNLHKVSDSPTRGLGMLRSFPPCLL